MVALVVVLPVVLCVLETPPYHPEASAFMSVREDSSLMFDFVFAVNLNPPEAISFNFLSSAWECVWDKAFSSYRAVFDREFDLAFFAFETVKASTFGLPFMPVGRDVALVFTLSSSLLPP